MEANRQAPVFGASEIEIAAAPDIVWSVLTDFGRWPAWNLDVKSIAIDGDVAPGTQFRWKAGPATITSVIREVEPPRSIAWTGRTVGTSAKHVDRLEAADGRTRVRTEESFEGWLPRLLRRQMRTTLQNGLDDGLRDLKAEAERRAP